MRRLLLTLTLALSLVGVLPASSALAAPAFTTIDVPGATRTLALGINKGGAIVGYFDDGTTIHGFLRRRSGVITTIDGAQEALGINSTGSIVGIPTGGSSVAFLRDPSGHMSTFMVPGSGSTIPTGINDHGDIVGYFNNGTGIHGFLRSAAGTYTTIDVPGAVGVFGTEAQGINNAGVIVGYFDDGTTIHGFLRDTNGSIMIIDAPGSTHTLASGISQSGAIVGSDSGSGGNHGYRRSPSGTFVTVDPPGASMTSAEDVSVAGIAGWFVAGGTSHGFFRTG
jgi:hypothetical protein